jgi:hypothetical protein
MVKSMAPYITAQKPAHFVFIKPLVSAHRENQKEGLKEEWP